MDAPLAYEHTSRLRAVLERVNWEQYVAHWITNISPLSATGTSA
jgi:hypothetical protein